MITNKTTNNLSSNTTLAITADYRSLEVAL